MLDVRVAARYDHYSDFGGDFNPSVDLRFRPNDALVLRGGWNTGFRAPSLAQAGAGTTAASFTLPCTRESEFFANFCGSRVGSPTILSQVLANPDLEPETSEAWNLGLVWSPAPGPPSPSTTGISIRKTWSTWTTSACCGVTWQTPG